MKKLTMVVLVALGVLACKVGERPYQRIAADPDVTSRKKDIVSPWVSRHFPVTTVYLPGKIDTVENVVTDTETLDQLGRIINQLLTDCYDNDSLKRKRIDSLISAIKQKCPATTTTQIIHKRDTIVRCDPAEIDGWRSKTFRLEQELNVERAKAITADSSRKAAWKYTYIAGGILLFLLVLFALWLGYKLKKP